jgi:Tfp pilus assembly protein PilF
MIWSPTTSERCSRRTAISTRPSADFERRHRFRSTRRAEQSGYALLLTVRNEEARALYEKALALQPDFPEVLNNLNLL